MGHIKGLSFDPHVGRKGLRLKVNYAITHIMRVGIPLQNGAHLGALI